jgi:hypothetical protein
MRLAWSSREVEDRLHDIMCSIHQTCVDHGKRADDSVSYVMVRTLVASFAWPTRCWRRASSDASLRRLGADRSS